MQYNQSNSNPKQSSNTNQKDQGKIEFKNQNPNQNHNTKKVSNGPNTKR